MADEKCDSNDVDFYAVLGLDRSATDEEIRRSYRRLALIWHPDKHNEQNRPEAERQFKMIATAYEALRDPEGRRLYDLNGHQRSRDNQFNFDQGFGGGRSSRFRFRDPFEIFQDFFRGDHDDDVFSSVHRDDPFAEMERRAFGGFPSVFSGRNHFANDMRSLRSGPGSLFPNFDHMERAATARPPSHSSVSTSITIVNGVRTEVRTVTDASGNSRTERLNPDGTTQIFINGVEQNPRAINQTTQQADTSNSIPVTIRRTRRN